MQNEYEAFDNEAALEQSSEVLEAQEGEVSEDEMTAELGEVIADDEAADDIEGEADVSAETERDLRDIERAERDDPEAQRVDAELEADLEDGDAEAAAVAAASDAAADGDEIVEGDADPDAPAEVDPYEAFKKELRRKPGKWYVVHSYAGFERRVQANIMSRKDSLNMENFIFEAQVPMEDVVEIKNGQRKLVTRVRVPSYVLVRMMLNEDSWSAVRHTPGVTGFVGNAHNPTPLRFQEAFDMLKSLVEVEPAQGKGEKGQAAATGNDRRSIPAEIDFEIGETITIKEGSFAGLPGTINEIKPESGKLTVLVSLFERETPVELSFNDVTKLQ